MKYQRQKIYFRQKKRNNRNRSVLQGNGVQMTCDISNLDHTRISTPLLVDPS